MICLMGISLTYRYVAEALVLGGDGQHVVEIHDP